MANLEQSKIVADTVTATTTTITLDSAVTSGNLVVLAFSSASGTTLATSITGGSSTWTKIQELATTPSISLWYSLNAGGETTFTINHVNSGSDRYVAAAEYSGVILQAPTASTVYSPGGSSTSFAITPVTVANDNDLTVASLMSPVTVIVTPTTPNWTELERDSTYGETLSLMANEQSSTPTEGVSGTLNISSSRVGVIASFESTPVQPALSPPDGWLTSPGSWNNGIERNPTSFITGNSSIQFSSGATTADIFYSDFFRVNNDSVNTNTTSVYHLVTSLIKESGAANTVEVYIEYWDESRTTLLSTDLVYLPAGVAGWNKGFDIQQVFADSTWARLKVIPQGTLTASEILDNIKIVTSPSFIFAFTNTPSIPAVGNTFQYIQNWTINQSNLFSIDSNTGAGRVGDVIRMHEAGFYNICCTVNVDSYKSGQIYQLAMDNLTGFASLGTTYGQTVYSAGSSTAPTTPNTIRYSLTLNCIGFGSQAGAFLTDGFTFKVGGDNVGGGGGNQITVVSGTLRIVRM